MRNLKLAVIVLLLGLFIAAAPDGGDATAQSSRTSNIRYTSPSIEGFRLVPLFVETPSYLYGIAVDVVSGIGGSLGNAATGSTGGRQAGRDSASISTVHELAYEAEDALFYDDDEDYFAIRYRLRTIARDTPDPAVRREANSVLLSLPSRFLTGIAIVHPDGTFAADPDPFIRYGLRFETPGSWGDGGNGGGGNQ